MPEPVRTLLFLLLLGKLQGNFSICHGLIEPDRASSMLSDTGGPDIRIFFPGRHRYRPLQPDGIIACQSQELFLIPAQKLLVDIYEHVNRIG